MTLCITVAVGRSSHLLVLGIVCTQQLGNSSLESGYGISSTQSFWKVISPPRCLGLKDKKAIDLGVLDFPIPCIACANLISMPKALSESRRRAVFTCICWQLSGAEICCVIPLEIAKYLTGLNSLIFLLLFFFPYRHPVVKGRGCFPPRWITSGDVQKERAIC